jgi:hypothetical protein
MAQQLPLSQNKFALVDDDDFARLSVYRWFYRPERNGGPGYAIRHAKVDGETKTEYLHRAIMNPAKGMTVIFENHNRLDCQKQNLLVVTTEQARRHHRVRSDNKTGSKGISYNDYAKTWSADVYRNGTCKRVGTFNTRQEAITEYERAVAYIDAEENAKGRDSR